MDMSKPVEEETVPYYDSKRFYPTYLGEILHGRYQIATKLGYGTNSTVWLARDLYRMRWSSNRYVAVKITAVDRAGKGTAENELCVSQVISKADMQHEGKCFVRTLLDSFILRGRDGRHICLVFEPLREPLWLMKNRFEENVIPSEILKLLTQQMLHGLDYLHTKCHIIHAGKRDTFLDIQNSDRRIHLTDRIDLKLDNIMVRLENGSVLESSARDEWENPLPQKAYDDRTIYLSRNDYGQPASVTGIISITDFDHSIESKVINNGCIQAEVYRAPEVILDAGWTYSVDIWSLGVMVYELLEGRSLFEAVDPLKIEYHDSTHLAHITTLLGPPPKDLLARGRRTSLFYNAAGELEPASFNPKTFDLEASVTKIEGEDKRMFLAFMRKMLTWEPKDRSTAKELLNDPWLGVNPLEI